jgi:hypothetical protein
MRSRSVLLLVVLALCACRAKEKAPAVAERLAAATTLWGMGARARIQGITPAAASDAATPATAAK